ncbi:MAG TPA: hypothetical protein PLM35_08760 [Cyclobacteriaceae bacterium]|nr:hypothetical protein [Cyclobacteriaceae bacterium]
MDTSQYFYRNVILSKKDNKVSLIDIHNPDRKGQALDPWLGLVLQYANGHRTIEDLIKDLSGRYNGPPPTNLEATIYSVITRLVGLRFIVLTREAMDLPYYLSLPYEQLDIEKAKESLKQDNVKLD